MEEGLVKKFIEKNADVMYEKMNKKFSFNIWSMLFSFFYFIYRKMYLVALVIFIIQVLISGRISIGSKIVGVNTTNGMLISILFNIICGFVFYPLYKIHVTKRINKINEKATTEEEINSMCEKKGGVSIVKLILISLSTLVIAWVVTAIILFVEIAGLGSYNKTDRLKKELNQLYGNNYELIDIEEYSNFAGDDYAEGLIKVNNTYAIAYYDEIIDTFFCNYDGIKEGEKYLLEKYFDFPIKTMLYVNVDVQKKYEYGYTSELLLMINSQDFNTEKLAKSIKKMYDELGEKLGDCRIFIVLTNEINDVKTEKYNLYFTTEISHQFWQKQKYERLLYIEKRLILCIDENRTLYGREPLSVESIKKELNNNL